jgi:hypothetical protein
MFRPVRTLLFIFLAFVAGIIYERSNQSENCREQGGRFVDGLCQGGS